MGTIFNNKKGTLRDLYRPPIKKGTFSDLLEAQVSLLTLFLDEKWKPNSETPTTTSREPPRLEFESKRERSDNIWLKTPTLTTTSQKLPCSEFKLNREHSKPQNRNNVAGSIRECSDHREVLSDTSGASKNRTNALKDSKQKTKLNIGGKLSKISLKIP